jgi:autotransporter-associated beta strand protein
LNDGGGTNVLNDAGGTNTLNASTGTNTLVGRGGGHNTLNVASGLSITGSGSGYNLSNGGSGAETLTANSDPSGTIAWNLDSHNTYQGYAGPLTTGNAGQLSLVKAGTGSQTLSGQNIYSGSTTIGAGTLVLDSTASLGNTAIEVMGGATLAAHPSAANPLTAGVTGSTSAGATLALDSSSTFSMTDGATGTFNLTQQSGFSDASLSVNSAALNFNLSSTGSDQLADAGSAAVSGTNTINITGLGSSLSSGCTYTLVSATSGLSGNFVFANGTPIQNLTVGGHTYTLALRNTDTAETVTVGSTDYWVGTSTANTWDTSAANWSATSGGSVHTTFHNGDVVVFDDAAAASNVTLPAGVSPSAIIFNNSSNHPYTINGSASIGIGGAGTWLSVGGGGSVTLVGANTFSGLTTLSAHSTLQLGNSSGNGAVGGDILDNAGLIFANPAPQPYAGAISGVGSVNVTGAGTLTLSGASTYSGATTVGSTSTLAAGAADAFSPNSTYAVSGKLDLAGNDQAIVSLTGNGTVTNSAPSTATLTASGDSAGTTFSGVMQDGTSGGGALALTMLGPGTETLSGANTFTGAATISGGTLQIANNLALQDAAVEIDSPGAISFASAVTAPVFASLSGNANIALATANSAAVNLTVGNDNADTTYSGVLSGPGGLTKTGADTLTLTGGVSTYTGATHVAGGAIRLSDNNHQILTTRSPPARPAR